VPFSVRVVVVYHGYGGKNYVYSLLRHIGKAVYFGSYRDSQFMALFSAYFDASGNKRKTVLTVAGFVSRVEKWDRFNEQWKAILKSEGVSSMHMTDFASSLGEFTSWKGQSERRKTFVAALANCIRRNTNKGFGNSVILKDYKSIDRDFTLHERVGQPYTLCARTCFGGLRRWAKKKKINPERILVFVEHGDEDQGELVNHAREDGFKIAALSKEDAVAFEAGDMAAWKFRTAIHNAAYGPMAGIEDAANIIRSLDPIKAVVQRSTVFNAEELQLVCRRDNIPGRA